MISKLRDALGFLQKGDLAQAEAVYRTILASDPRNVDACHMLSLVLHHRGHNADALDLIERATEIDPDHVAAHCHRAKVSLALNRPAEALSSYDRVLHLRPDHVDARLNHGDLLQRLLRMEAALLSYDRGLAFSPDHVALHVNRGNVLKSLGRIPEALAAYDRAIALNPGIAEAFNNRGVVLFDLGRFAEALASYDRAVALNPGYAEAFNNRGLALFQLGQVDAALASYERALTLKPSYAAAFNNRGHTLSEMARFDEALADYDRAVALDPDYAEACNNRGLALLNLGRLDEALASYRRAAALRPDLAEAWFGVSQVLLLQGQFAEGWKAYAWRLRAKDHAWIGDIPGVWATPAWSGEDISGKVLLVYAEQGLGDTLQFVRYLPSVAKMARQVVFMVQPALIPLLQTIEGITLARRDAPPPDFDCHCPLLSLPHILHTDAASIPAEVPYLKADPVRVAHWRRRIGETGFRVGIAWQGNAKVKIDRGRSIPLACFAPLAAVPGVRLISLQKNDGLDQLARCPPPMRIEILGADFDGGPGAFLDTAAVMKNLDLVVTSDTAVAHLAGALGRETWVALKTIPDWRWQVNRPDSPWYPTMRLFRQSNRGDWPAVFMAIADELRRGPYR